jgi:acyl carrier protein
MTDFVRDQLMEVLRIDSSSPPDRSARLMELGVDSLVAVDFARRLERELDGTLKLPATLIFDYPTIEATARYLLNRIGFGDAASPPEKTSRDGSAAKRMTSDDIAGLSDDEVDALIKRKLDTL